MTEYIRRHTPYLRGSALLRDVQERGAGSKLHVYQSHGLKPRSNVRRSDRAARKHAVHRQKPMDRRTCLSEGGGGQMGLLYEDSCRERLKQGEQVGQALTEAHPPDINRNQGGVRVCVCVCVVSGAGVGGRWRLG